jgi:pyrroloquinoline quinone (PQQ) biosynthesis protein C
MQVETKVLDVSWLKSLDKGGLDRVLLEYELISRNFVPWLLFVMANAEDERVRNLLLPNLNEECGEPRKNNSHHALYLRMIKSFGLQPEDHSHAPSTVRAEKSFRDIFRGGDTYRSLCVIGPAMEAISSDFLTPMYEGVKKHHGESKHLIYFTLHLSEMEDEHAGSIERAISLMEEKCPGLKGKKSEHTQEGITIFEAFWGDLKKIVQTGEG